MNIGSILRSAREEKKQSIANVAALLKINKKYIQALEDENILLIPSPVFAKGFLKAYTEYLEVDQKPLLQELLQFYKGIEETKAIHSVIKRNPKIFIDKKVVGYVVAVSVSILIILLFAFALRFSAGNKKALIKTNPPAPQKALIKKLEIKVLPLKQVNIKIEAISRSWIIVVVDKENPYEETLEPGKVLSFSGKVITVKTGNAGGIKITRDGQSYGVMGEPDQVIQHTYNVAP